MNTVIVYFSKFGHTRRLAEAMAEALASQSTVRVLGMGELDAEQLKHADLVIAGAPTHRMNLPEAVRNVIGDLPRRLLGGTPVAAFDTSYRMNALLARFTAGRRLASRLRRLGGRRIAPPETFYVMGREGPLEDGEVERAKAWAASVLDKTESLTRAPVRQCSCHAARMRR